MVIFSSYYLHNYSTLGKIRPTPLWAFLIEPKNYHGGVTSFVEAREHYLAYIPYKDEVLLYDGLPKDYPVLRKYCLRQISGDISLLCYFPLDSIDSPEVRTGTNKIDSANLRNKVDVQEVPVSCNMDKVSGVIELDSKPSVSGISSEKRNNDSNIELTPVPDNHEESDHLLAKALFEMENENTYKKTLGKSYRVGRKVDEMSSSPQSVDINRCSPLSSVPSPPSSVSSFDDVIDVSHVLPIIEFINQKKDFILTLVSDSTYSSEFHLRSERIIALKKCSSLKNFAKFAKEEYGIICARMQPYIGTSFLPYAPLIHHINFEILTEELIPDTMYDIRGKWPMPIKIRSFADKYDTIRYVVLPEIFTEYLMERNCTGYKEAAKDLYGGILPTTHHVNMLVNDIILNALSIKGARGNVTLQIVEGDLYHQYTHAIMNITDPNLMNNDEFSASLVDVGGRSIHHACETYVEKNGPLNIGEVVSLSSGNLRCFYLFYSVFSKSEKSIPEESVIKSALSAAFSEANSHNCKSLSIPAVEFSQKTIKKIVNVIIDIVSANDIKTTQTLEIIRFVGKRRTILKLYQKAL